jgi:hypothetical protein
MLRGNAKPSVARAGLEAFLGVLAQTSGAVLYPRVVRRSASPFIWRQTLSCRSLAKLGRKNAPRERCDLSSPAIAGEGDHLAQQDGGGGAGFDAALSLKEICCGDVLQTRRSTFIAKAASSPAPPPPSSARFARYGWSPSPAFAGEDEVRAARMVSRTRCWSRAGIDDAPPIPWRDIAER